MKLLTFFLLLFIKNSHSIILECDFEFDYKSDYYCHVKNPQLITSEFDREINGIKGTHNSSLSDEKVTGLSSHGSVIKFFPRHLTKFFRNLENILIYNASLEDIKKEDLRQFGDKLKDIELTGNLLTTIEADLFVFNKNLTTISLYNNKITHIESGTFDKLKNLKNLDLEENPCANFLARAVNNTYQVINVIERAEQKCKDPNYIPLNCEFHHHIGVSGYTCYIKFGRLITSEKYRTIARIKGRHRSGKINQDVLALYAYRSIINFFPRNVTKFFKNIEDIYFDSVGLKEIAQEDLQQFGGNLKKLWLKGNQITTINDDLFEFNPNLEEIYLPFNKIVQIDDKAFESLRKLKAFSVRENPCTNEKDFSYGDEVYNKTRMVVKHCKSIKNEA